jgi:hypothetical protein
MLSPEACKKALWGAGVVAACFFVLQIAPPIAHYFESPYAPFLKELASASYAGLFGIGISAWILMRTGLLPSPPQDPAVQQYRISSRSMLRNLAFWIVISVVLVFFFNFAQDKDFGFGTLDDRTIDLFIKVFPFVLMLGVWVFFLWRMQVKKKRDLDSGSNP